MIGVGAASAHDRRLRLYTVSAAAVWIAAGVGYFALEAVAAAGFRRNYSYADNYISDLGATSVGMSHGRMIDSPLAHLMNGAFCLQGILFLVGAVLVARAAGSDSPTLFLAFAAMNTIGNILVGSFHSGPGAAVTGTGWVHATGAVLAIVGGNMAIVTGSALARDAGAAQWFRAASLGLAVLGLLSFLMFVVDLTNAAVDILPAGVWERGSVYSTIVWQMFTAVYLLIGLLCQRLDGRATGLRRYMG